MKRIVRFCLMVSATIILFSSCSKKGSGDAKYIPKDAALVMSFNLKAMNDTLEKAGMGFDSLFNKMSPKDHTGKPVSSEMDDIKNAGIDWRKNVHIFTMQYNTVKGNITVMNAMGTLHDTEKFASFLKKQDKYAEIVKEKELSYAFMSPKAIVAWDGSKVIVSNYEVKSNMDSIGMYDTAPQDLSRFKTDMIAEVKKYFTLESSASLAGVDAFTDLAKEDAHGFYWMNMHALTQLPGGMQFPRLSEMLKDSYAASTFNFERGKIVSDSRMYFGKALQDIMEKNESPAADMSLVDRYPSKNINGFYIFSLNPQVIAAILKEAQLEALANAGLAKEGLQVQDILNAVKGDVAFVMSDMGNVPPSATGEPGFANWLVNITIKDRAALDKIINVGVQKGAIVRQGDYILFNSGVDGPQAMPQKIKVTATNLFIGSDSVLIENYIAGKGGALSADIKKRFEGKAAAGYFNFNSLNMNGAMGRDNPMAMVFAAISSFTGQFNEAVLTADKYDDGVMKGHGELTFKDNSQNSMVVLVKSVTDMIGMFTQMGANRYNDQMPSGQDWEMPAADSTAPPSNQ